MSAEIWAMVGAVGGLIGAVAGALSLGWQILIHRRTGRLVSVIARYSIPVYGPVHDPLFKDDDVISIEVFNRGGAPVTVMNYGVSLGRRRSANLNVIERPTWGSRLPFAVEPGGTPAQLLVPVANLREIHQTKGIPFKDMRPWVDLGDGRRVFSRQPVPMR